MIAGSTRAARHAGIALARIATVSRSATTPPYVTGSSRDTPNSSVTIASVVILIVLGESIVSIGLAAEDRRVDPPLLFGAIAGLMAVAAMWRAYFIGDDTRAAEAFERASGRVRTDQALLGYGLAHLVMIDGVIAVAAGAKLSIHQLASTVPAWDAWLIAGGAVLFMAGSALFRRVMGFASPWPRLAGVPLCLAAVPAGTRGSAAAELASLAVLITLALFLDHLVEWQTTGRVAR